MPMSTWRLPHDATPLHEARRPKTVIQAPGARRPYIRPAAATQAPYPPRSPTPGGMAS